MTPESISLLFAFIIGAAVGSFLNVVIHRVPRGQSIVSPPSSCPSCKTGIRWYHNIPIVSYLALRGRCANCNAPFSPRYLAVEVITGACALACVSVFGLTPFAARAFLLVAILIALTYIDLEHWLLPHVITWPAIVLGLATSWVEYAPGLQDAAIGAAAGFAGFWALRILASLIFRKEALGGGDLWLLALIGAFLGWQALLPVVFLASVQGSAVGIFLLLLTRVKGKPAGDEAPGSGSDEPAEGSPKVDEDEEEWKPPPNAVPFGPFLSLAALQMLFFGDAVMDFVARLMGMP